jgi:hypothetical protein
MQTFATKLLSSEGYGDLGNTCSYLTKWNFLARILFSKRNICSNSHNCIFCNCNRFQIWRKINHDIWRLLLLVIRQFMSSINYNNPFCSLFMINSAYIASMINVKLPAVYVTSVIVGFGSAILWVAQVSNKARYIAVLNGL